LLAHPAVREAAVFTVADPRWGERIEAAVALRSGATVDAGALIAFCKTKIAGYKTPKAIWLLDALPRLGSGKIDKRALRDSVR
jgi:acyl-CoA synthetase (AMP-forming)/AMP-acid ligase II